jgi:predicted transposase YdaD
MRKQEIQTMLLIKDIRESRVYQDAMKEGIEKGIAIARLAAEKKSVAEIAAILKVDVELVNQVLAQADRN